jgi:hypothetical protein
MERLMLRYTVRPEALADHLQLLHAVYEELAERRPDGFSWVTYQLEGDAELLELAAAERLPGPLPDLASFRRYREGLEQRCSQRVVSDLTLVGAYPRGDLDVGGD